MPCIDIKNYLKNGFDYPRSKLFCQVSTAMDGDIHIRTMNLYHITDSEHFVFLTGTSTRKWLDLKSNSNIGVCMLDKDYGQIIMEGSTILKTRENDFSVTSFYWDNYLDSYWRNFYGSLEPKPDNSSSRIPLSFGVIIIKPHYWEILEIDKIDYLNSIRTQYCLQDGSWLKGFVSPV